MSEKQRIPIFAEITSGKLIITSPEKKIFCGTGSSQTSRSELTSFTFPFDPIKADGKIIVFHRRDYDSFMVDGNISTAVAHVILDDLWTSNQITHSNPIPLFHLNKDESKQFIKWQSLVLQSEDNIPLWQPACEHEDQNSDEESTENDFSHLMVYKKIRRRHILDRRGLYQSRFGELKPTNITPIFDTFYHLVKEGADPFEVKDKNNLVFLFVSGLYSGRFPGRQISYPNTLRFLQDRLGVDVRTLDIKLDESGYVNGLIISNEVSKIYKNEQKQVVLIGHSKGSVDIAAAITLYPKMCKKVRLFISLMGVFGGSPIASVCSHSGSAKQEAKMVVKKLINRFMKSSTEALVDITMESRHNFLEQHQYPTGAVPTVSVIASRAPKRNLLYNYIHRLYHEQNDGLITVIDAHIPGSSVIFIEGMDHGGPPTGIRYENSDSFLTGICAASLIATSSRVTSVTETVCVGDQQPPIDKKKFSCCSLPFNHTTVAFRKDQIADEEAGLRCESPRLTKCLPSNEEIASDIASFLQSSWDKKKKKKTESPPFHSTAK